MVIFFYSKVGDLGEYKPNLSAKQGSYHVAHSLLFAKR